MQNDRARHFTSFLAHGRRFLALTLAVLFAGPALAVDGVIEINQASAEAGVAPGDAPGLPVTLTLRGGYRLTGDLAVPTDTTGIVTQNDQLHIDRNGFSIVGGGGTSGVVSECIASFNASDGIVVNGGVVSQSHARENQGIGVFARCSTTVTHCNANCNGSHGIRAVGGPILGNGVWSNGGFGLVASSSTAYGDNSFLDNSGGPTQVSGGVSLGSNVCAGSTTGC